MTTGRTALPARVLSVILVLSVLLAACQAAARPELGPATAAPPAAANPATGQPAAAGDSTGQPQVTPTPFQPQPPTATFTPQPTATPLPGVWVAPYLPAALQQVLALPPGFVPAGTPEQAGLRLVAGGEQPLVRWVYALVTPFPTLTDGVSAADLQAAWGGGEAGPFAGRPLLMDESTLGVLSAVWGRPAGPAVKVLPAGSLLDEAWKAGRAWAIVPFEALEPRWKVLSVAGQSPLAKDFNPAGYPLTVTFGLEGNVSLLGASPAPEAFGLPAPEASGLPASNRDPQKLTTVVMTGVTALVRATADTMRRKGLTYPAQDVGEILRAADIAHVSNEIPFAQNCPQPDPYQADLRFCSRPEYIELLDAIGTDVVELTGDHFGDWGAEAMRFTLDLYKERNWTYYGGGYNTPDGRAARTFEHNGNKIAFIGCNAKGGFYASARENNPGAVDCDWDWMHAEIARLTGEGYQVITTFQHFEYYTYVAQPNQKRDSRGMTEAGAVIVSGSQAHQPQGIEFHQGGFIHYGLGNLFFDQYHMGLPTGQGFLDRHVFYNGKYISTELIGIRFVDFARPRLMTPAEREELLQAVFKASGW